jgi:hypothetical protein
MDTGVEEMKHIIASYGTAMILKLSSQSFDSQFASHTTEHTMISGILET